MYFKRLKRMSGRLTSVGGVLALWFLFGCNSQQEDKQEREPLDAAPERVAAADPDYSGRLYTSGLSPEEAEKLQLQWPVYQIVGSKNYFLSGPDTLQHYLGRCLALHGEVKQGWEGQPEYVNGQTTYNRTALAVRTIAPLPFAACPGQEVAQEEQSEPGNLKAYSGKLRRMVRPAPDIAYDYALQLDEPYRDKNHPIEPGKLVTELPLVVFRNDKLNKLEEALAANKTVVIEAAREPGYAESTVLRVVKILRPEVEEEEISRPEI